MDLASREGYVPKKGTPGAVAPNSYIILDECCNYKKKNLTPFLSSTDRWKVPKIFDPPFYDLYPNPPKIKYGNSMLFTDERKTIVLKTDTINEEKIVKPQNIRLSPIPKKIGRKGKVAYCRVPFTHGYSAPTIPPKNSTGYNVDSENILHKNPSSATVRAIGPTTYDVPIGDPCFNTRRYKGCAWSKSKAPGKQSFIINNNPSPSAYYPKDVQCIQYRADIQNKPLMRKCCNVPRFTCELSCKSKFAPMPAPGTYEIVDLDKIGKVKNFSRTPKPFMSLAPRFRFSTKDIHQPGPMTYQACDCFKLKRDFNVADIPFNYSSQRFKSKKGFSTPSPGQYDIKDPVYHSYGGTIQKAPFGSTARRKYIEVRNLCTPNPSSYDPQMNAKCFKRENEKRTSVFRSMVCRFGRPKSKTDLSAASYNLKLTAAKPNVNAFNSTDKKGRQILDFAGYFTLLGKDTPGVGTYNLGKCSCESGGYYFTVSPRGKSNINPGPGPGHYNLHPSTADAVWAAKKTHNYRLLSNVLRSNPNMKGPKLGMRSVVKSTRKKILRLFVKTGEYQHCY